MVDDNQIIDINPLIFHQNICGLRKTDELKNTVSEFSAYLVFLGTPS
jgi:hypothetical protein